MMSVLHGGHFLSLMVTFVMLCSQTEGSMSDPDIHPPCLGCRLFNIKHRQDKEEAKRPDTKFCHYPCQCPIELLSCHEGVNFIKDGCGCCYMCARQQGDVCTVRDLCDSSKGIYCDRNVNDDASLGHCKVKEKQRSCNVNGIIYEDGEKFQPKCSEICTCQNGFYGCVGICPQEEHKPSELTCHEPKLMKVKNKCCREWTCQKMEADEDSRVGLPGLEIQALVNPSLFRTTTSPAPRETTTQIPETCHGQTTDWSPCSTTCDMGVSIKIVVDPLTCQKAQQQKLCYIRPCGRNITTYERDKCTATTRVPSPVHIKYQDCLSVKEYNLRYCTTCKENYCCYPKKTRTQDMEFQCSGGVRRTFEFMRIKKCRCSKVCYKKDKKKKGISREKRRLFRERRKERRRLRKMKSKRQRLRRRLARNRQKRRLAFGFETVEN